MVLSRNNNVYKTLGGIKMSTRERITTIRLMDKAAKHPLYATLLGIEMVTEKEGVEDAGEPP